MLCENFALSLKEFEQLFAFPDSEMLFQNLDHNGNGLIDGIEFFCILAIFSDSRIEDRMRFIFEIFDFNEDGVLEEVDLQFLIYTVL